MIFSRSDSLAFFIKFISEDVKMDVVLCPCINHYIFVDNLAQIHVSLNLKWGRVGFDYDTMTKNPKFMSLSKTWIVTCTICYNQLIFNIKSSFVNLTGGIFCTQSLWIWNQVFDSINEIKTRNYPINLTSISGNGVIVNEAVAG